MGSRVELALGRILRLASRPSEPGDVEDYERCRAVTLDALDPLNEFVPAYEVNWSRDRMKGAQGDV